MGVIDFLLVAGAAIVGVLATAVYGMLALPAGYFRAARICAVLAATIFAALGVLWATETSYMFFVRALVVGGIAAVAAIALTEALRQIKHHEDSAGPPKSKQTALAAKIEPTLPAAKNESRRKYLRADAEVLIPVLRKIFTILNESVRDSTSLESWFRSGGSHPSFLVGKVLDVRNFLTSVQDQVSATYADNRSLGQYIHQYVEATNPSPEFMAEINDAIAMFRAMENSKLTDSNVSALVNRYSQKMRAGIEAEYKKRVAALRACEAQIAEVTAAAE